MVFLGIHVTPEHPVLIVSPLRLSRATLTSGRNAVLVVKRPLAPDVLICKQVNHACELNIDFDETDVKVAPPLLYAEQGEWDLIGQRTSEEDSCAHRQYGIPALDNKLS